MSYPGYPPPSANGSPAPPTPSGSSNTAQAAIESEMRTLLRGQALAAGLQGLGDVISHLPPIRPVPTSFFPPSSSTSLQASSTGLIPSEDSFEQYSREIALLLGGQVEGLSEGEAERYRSEEVRRVLGSKEMQEQLQGIRQGVQQGTSYGGLPPLQPPYAFNNSGPVAMAPPNSSFPSQFLHASAFPLPPLPSTSAIPSIPPFPSTSHPPSAPIDAFVNEQLARAAAAAAASASMHRSSSTSSHNGFIGNPHTPSTAANGGRTYHLSLPPLPQAIPTSSPDPLSFTHAPSSSRPKITVVQGGVRHTAEQPLGKKRSSASLAPSHSPTQPHSRKPHHDFDIIIPVASPGRKVNGKGKAKAVQHSASFGGGDETPRASQGQLGAPFPFANNGGGGSSEATGVESGMKRFKLDSLARTAATPGTGASGGGKVGVVEKLDDLLSDIFGADDGFVLDSSSAALGQDQGASQGGSAPSGCAVNRSPSRRAGKQTSAEEKFFRTTAVSPSSNLPLLHTETLKTLLRHVRTVAAKGKAEELLEAVEENGIGRLLKLLERSWDGVDGLEVWDWEAMAPRDDAEPEVDGKKGKGGKGGKKASPAKGKKAAAKGGRGRKKSVAADEDDEGSDDECDELESSPAKGGRRRSSRTPSPARSPSAELPPSSPSASQNVEGYWTSERLSSTQRALRTLHDALLAIRLALEVLTLPLPPATPLPKHLFSSDYLTSLIATLRKGALDNCFLPLLESPSSSPLAELSTARAGGTYTKDQISEISDSLQGAVEGLARLVRREELGEDLVISLSYLALEPFFHDAAPPPSSSKGKQVEGQVVAAAKTLRMESLRLTQALYGRYAEQRAWMLEEVLSNLGKGDSGAGGKMGKNRGAIRLRNGASIQTISALLLHLVQTPPSSLYPQVRRRLAQAERALKAESGLLDENGDSQMAEELGVGKRALEGNAEEEEEDDGDGTDVLASIARRLVRPAVETAQRAARTIIGFLLQRSAKAGKLASGSADTEYRAVLDHLISDLLSTLHLPEWPGAEVLLGTFCRSMMASLADTKSSHDANSLKSIALDHLGRIAARIRNDLESVEKGQLEGLRGAVAGADIDALEKVFTSQKVVLEHLSRPEKSGGGSEDAAAFTRLTYARDLNVALEHAQRVVTSFSSQELASETAQAAQAVVDRLEVLSKAIWEDVESDDVFGPSQEDAQPHIDAVCLDLWRSSSLADMYNPLLERIVEASESTQITQRSKALRAIGLVVAQDPELFHQENFRHAIEARMVDAASSVRDTAIELVGKYVVNRPDLAVQYLPRLAERIHDTGLGVRRRIVKLLKVLYHVVPDEANQIDICRRLVFRVADEDDGIKDLAVDSIEELWFGASTSSAKKSTNDVGQLAQVILKTTGVFRDRPPPVDEVLRHIMAKHLEKGTPAPLDRVKEVMEALIDGLVEDDYGMDIIAAVKTVSVLNAVDASLLSMAKATLLLPFLKSATTAEEQTISDNLLRIFRAGVLASPKTSTKFGKDLQASLLPMLNKPSANPQTMHEVVACFCAVVLNQTQDYTNMIKVFTVTLNRLRAEAIKLSKPETTSTVNPRQVSVLSFMTALFCEHGEFDRLREEQPTTKAAIDNITPRAVSEQVFGLLVGIHNLPVHPAIKQAVLTSLGFVYRAYPLLMLNTHSTGIIDAIFDSPNQPMHLQVLRIIADFLASQEQASVTAAAQPAKKKKAVQGVKMEELVGNVEGFADSGVASAISQRYLPRIIASSLSTTPALSLLGVDLLSTIAKSGFSHPITLSPTLVALTASSDNTIASKAYSTLALIHQKHASLLATRFLEPARAAHEYVKSTSGDKAVRGWRGDPPEALLGRWFSLLHKEKRQVQLDYLKTLSRAFDVEAGAKCSENDVSFARFLAESLSTFDYKRTEEPLLVIATLNLTLAVSGLQVLHHLEQDLEGGGGLLAVASPSKGGHENQSAAKAPTADLARQSVISGLALLLRDHLKQVYGITDVKIAKYVVGKKSPAGDKPVNRRADASLALGNDYYERMPYALAPLDGEEALCAQRETYRRLIQEDGTIGAMEELDDDE